MDAFNAYMHMIISIRSNSLCILTKVSTVFFFHQKADFVSLDRSTSHNLDCAGVSPIPQSCLEMVEGGC